MGGACTSRSGEQASDADSGDGEIQRNTGKTSI